MTKLEFNEENLTKEQIEQLESIVKESKKKKVWKPKYGDKVYYISQTGAFEGVTATEHLEFSTDRSMYKRGQLFQTEEQAEFYYEKQKVEFEIKKYAEEYNGIIDWANEKQWKYNIAYDHGCETIDIEGVTLVQESGTIYFTDKEDLLKCIKLVGVERIKKYLFEIEEKKND